MVYSYMDAAPVGKALVAGTRSMHFDAIRCRTCV